MQKLKLFVWRAFLQEKKDALSISLVPYSWDQFRSRQFEYVCQNILGCE
jgi:hypothetical protein